MDDEFDLEAVAVLEIAGLVIWAASVGVTIGEQQRPPVIGGVGDKLVELCRVADVEGEMIEPGTASVMTVGGQRGGLLDNDVRIAELPAASAVPMLVRRVAECGQEPSKAVDGAGEIGDPQLDVVQRSAHQAAAWPFICNGTKATELTARREDQGRRQTTRVRPRE